MIDCIFTIDYEIYGNGEGSLTDLVFQPTEKLIDIFSKHKKHFDIFVEVAELEMIKSKRTDTAIDLIMHQLRSLNERGYELGLHIHPGWYNAQYHTGMWHIDYNEYNLSALPKYRIHQIVDRAISYMKKIVNDDNFTPLSFRAGHLLFQPSKDLASVLYAFGVKVDSSMYKGGLWHQHHQDYRNALKNGNFWRFKDNINEPDNHGFLLELPIYTQMVPSWKMLTSKRVGLQGKGASLKTASRKLTSRIMDFMRLCYPLKFDIGQMTTDETILMMSKIIKIDKHDPDTYRPIVIIGHTKDLTDTRQLDLFLHYLQEKDISISTISQAYNKCAQILPN